MIDRLDHFVLTVSSIDETCLFYSNVLGMKVVEFGAGRVALSFGQQKINLHQAGAEFEPKSKTPTPGSGDFCFITETDIEDVIKHLAEQVVKIEDGPVARTGAMGEINSIYIRDPDGNLIEISNYC